MTSSLDDSVNHSSIHEISENEIDLRNVFAGFVRNKKLISLFALAGFFIGGVVALTQKRVWQGSFQIVLNNSTNKQSIPGINSLANIAGLETKSSKIDTEIGILKSPLVLMNVFEFVKREKENKKLRFIDWRNKNLDIALEKKTTILNLSYRDNNKELILPVLNSISTTYQEYSGRNRLRSIELGINYFEEQIEKFKNKSLQSSNDAGRFAIDQDLSILKSNDRKKMDLLIPNSINIESIRVEASNQIRDIDQELKQIEELEIIQEKQSQSLEQINFLALTIPSLKILATNLIATDNQLERYRLAYKEQDEIIQNLIKEREFLMITLKRKAIGYLKAQRADAKARLKASERPEGVLLKYKELLNKASKDKATLSSLEDQYRLMLLERARINDPWELITKPTLEPNPVAPKRKEILALGLLYGTLIGSSVSFIHDRRRDILFTINEIQSFTQLPLLEDIYLADKRNWNDLFNIIESSRLINKEENIGLVVVGDFNGSLLSGLVKGFESFSKNKKLKIVNEIDEFLKCSALVIVAAKGVTKRIEITKIKNKIKLINKPILGLLIVNDA